MAALAGRDQRKPVSDETLLFIWVVTVVYLLATRPARQVFERRPPDSEPPTFRPKAGERDGQGMKR